MEVRMGWKIEYRDLHRDDLSQEFDSREGAIQTAPFLGYSFATSLRRLGVVVGGPLSISLRPGWNIPRSFHRCPAPRHARDGKAGR
jgi:hypothetical protein